MADGLLKGKCVLLTGASQGIGSAIAEEYSRQGASLIIVARSTDKLESVAEKCKELGAEDVRVLQADVMNADDLVMIAKEVDTLDVLVNNAGTAQSGSILEGNPDDWEKLVLTNLVAPMKLTGLLAHKLVMNKGYIINISSVAGLHAIKGQAPYCASKHGMTGWSLTCFEDLKDHGVGVTAIFPAYVESSMTEDASFPSDKMIRPEDIAQAALLPFRMSRFAVPSEIVVRNAVRA